MKKIKYLLVICILILLPFTPYIFNYCTDIYKTITNMDNIQGRLNSYFMQKYPEHTISILELHYNNKIRSYTCSAKDENGIAFNTTIDENFKISDLYIENLVLNDLERKLSPFIQKVMESIDEPYFQVFASSQNDGIKKINLDITLPDKAKVKTVEEFSTYALSIKNEVLRLLESEYVIEELCIRINSFIVDFNNNQLNFNSKEIEKITITESGI